MDLLDREGLVGLRRLVGPSASIEALPAGWSLEDDGRRYRLTIDDRLPGPAAGLLEAWVGGRYHAAAGDWTLAAVCEDFARLLAQSDAALECVTVQDLF